MKFEMYSINKVMLMGNLGRDPEIRHTQKGNKIVNLAIATSERWTDKGTGEVREKTEWHNVVVFDQNIADVCERYIKKGSKVWVEGSLQTRKWQGSDGADRYTTEVVLKRFRGQLIILDGAAKHSDQTDRRGQPEETWKQVGSGTPSTPPPIDLDDEIPF